MFEVGDQVVIKANLEHSDSVKFRRWAEGESDVFEVFKISFVSCYPVRAKSLTFGSAETVYLFKESELGYVKPVESLKEWL